MTGVNFDVDRAFEKLAALVNEHGPAVVDTAASVVQVNAIQTLVGGLGGLAVAWFFRVIAKRGIASVAKRDYFDVDGSILLEFGIWTANVSAGLVLIWSVVQFTKVWAWVALFNPELALAHAIFEKVL